MSQKPSKNTKNDHFLTWFWVDPGRSLDRTFCKLGLYGRSLDRLLKDPPKRVYERSQKPSKNM
jgi:hypothetical protein